MMINILKKILPHKYKREIKEKLGVPSFHWSLENLKNKKFNPGMVLDIGAYEGYWTMDLLEVFPDAKVFMIEAQKGKAPFLEKVKTIYQQTEYSIALLSSVDNEFKDFYENETSSHVIKEPSQDKSSCKIQTITLDSLLEEKKIAFPDFLKLDVQGHELEVLKGAEKSLANSEVCLLEVSLLDFGDRLPLLAEVVSFMDNKNFQAYDISQFIRRPFDKALFQIDMFFVKKDSPIIASKRWD